jgi:hypothetical protein
MRIGAAILADLTALQLSDSGLIEPGACAVRSGLQRRRDRCDGRGERWWPE